MSANLPTSVARAFRQVSQLLAWLGGAKSSSAAVAHTLTARIGITGINVVTGILVARTLEAQGRGVQAAVSIWPIVLSGLFTLGIPTALRFYVPRYRERSPELFAASLVFASTLSIAAIVVGVFFIPFWLSSYDAASIRFAQLMMLFGPGFLIMLSVQAYMEAMGDFGRSNSATYVPALITLATLVLLALNHVLTPYTSSIAYLAPTSILAVYRIYTLRATLRGPIAAFSNNRRHLLSYGIKASAIDILTTLSLQIDQALVIRFLSPRQLGTYTVALAVSRLLNIFSQSLNSVLLPKAAALDREEAIDLVGRVARITFATAATAAAVLGICSPFVIPLLYGTAFEASVHLAQILFVEVTIGSTVAVLGQAFLSTGRPGIVATLQAVGLAGTLPFMLFLIPQYGLTGAALALLSSTVLRLIFILACFPALLRIAPPNLILTRGDIQFISSRFFRKT